MLFLVFYMSFFMKYFAESLSFLLSFFFNATIILLSNAANLNFWYTLEEIEIYIYLESIL